MLGSITKVYGEIIITTNQNLMLERQNFTKMHEIIHYYRDIPYLGESHAFSDMILEDTYLPEDYEKELRANIGVSILMANDQALSYTLRKFRNFDEVANYFFMSKSALRKRILQYLKFARGYSSAVRSFKGPLHLPVSVICSESNSRFLLVSSKDKANFSD